MKIFNSKLRKSKKRRPLTKKEFILIAILIFCIGSYSTMNYLLLPKWNEYNQSMEELKLAKEKCEALHNEFKVLNKTKEKRDLIKYQVNELAKTLPPYISEEDIILTIGKYGRNHNVSIQSVDLDKSDSSKANNFSGSNDKNGSNDQVQSNRDSSNTKNEKEMSSEVRGAAVITKSVTVAFSSDVKNLYNFIENFEKNDKKIAFKEMSLNKDKDTMISGTMKFQYIGYKDDQNKDTYNMEPKEIKGKETPFDGSIGTKPIKDESEIDTNFSLKLNKYDNQAPKFIFGEYKKVDTEIYNSTNEKITGKFTIEKEKDSEKFAYTYSLGSNSKTDSKNLIISNGKLVLKVDSNIRDVKEDIMQLILDVENKTEYPLEIYVSNDDIENPRFVLGNKQGNVYLKQVGN